MVRVQKRAEPRQTSRAVAFAPSYDQEASNRANASAKGDLFILYILLICLYPLCPFYHTVVHF